VLGTPPVGEAIDEKQAALAIRGWTGGDRRIEALAGPEPLD
jgi:hypothetical protein